MKDVLSAIAIRNRGRTDDHKQNQAEGIRHKMTLATFHHLIRIESLLTTHFGGLDALAIDDCDTWFWITGCVAAYGASQQGIDLLPGTIITPLSIIIPDMIPG